MTWLSRHWRHWFRGNPLCGPDGLRRFRRGWGSTAWSVGVMVFLAHSPVYLFYLAATSDPIPDMDDAWIINLLAASIGAMLIPIVALRRAPSGQDLQGMMIDLRLAGLSPGQITAGMLRHVGGPLLIFQILWLGLALGLLFDEETWREFRRMSWNRNDGAILGTAFLDGLVTPWLMLGFAWALHIHWRRLTRVAAVVVPLGVALNPIGLMLILMTLDLVGPYIDEDLIGPLQLVAPLPKAALALWMLRRMHRRFDRLIE